MKPLDLAYRPSTYEEVVGQIEAIKLLRGELVRSYILQGPSGTGKTTLAKIFAEEVNAHMMLLDATLLGKQEITDLKQSVANLPLFKNKIMVVLDEAHNLSKQAMEALLTTIEDGPAHAIWVLCTTEPRKILPTIQSRARVINLDRVAVEDILTYLKRISEAEGKNTDESILKQIAVGANGGVRKAVKLYETYLQTGVLALPTAHSSLIELTTAVYTYDIPKINKLVMGFEQDDILAYTRFISDYIIALMVYNSAPHIPMVEHLENHTTIEPNLLNELRAMQQAIVNTLPLPNSATIVEVCKSLQGILNILLQGYNKFGDNRYTIKALLALYAGSL